MPRPGPRPYECVRRAWHSDRHQPIRGSLIQHIFRLAHEVHSPTTLNNKEWLEKLPLVVLKAEEIMYSKANSEAEYMDLNTLWERSNDAIDTIIRRDDAPEETQGDLLPPCIEAALNLGCIPRRASRSQRHNNPGICYLSSINKGSSIDPLSSLSHMESWYSALVASNKLNQLRNDVDSAVPDGLFEPRDSAAMSNCGFSIPFAESLLSHQDRGMSVPVGTYNCPSLGRLYPLFCSNDQRKVLNPQETRGNANHSLSLPSVGEDGMSFLHNFIGSDNAKGHLNTSSIFGEASENPTGNGCDLSLRLGLFPSPSLDAESAWTHEVEDLGSSSSCDGNKYSSPSSGGARPINFESSFSSSKDKGFDFINVDTPDEPLESCSSKWSSEEEGNAIRQAL